MRLFPLRNLAWVASIAFVADATNPTTTSTTSTTTPVPKGMTEYEEEYGYIKWMVVGGQVYIWGQVAVFCYYWGKYLLNKETYDARMAEHRRRQRQDSLRAAAAVPAAAE